MNSSEKLLYRPREAADALGIGLTKVYELIASGEIPSVTVGRSKRVPVDALRERIHQQLQAAAAAR